jgi:hypothetical protein
MFHNEWPAKAAKPLLQTTGTEMKTANWTTDRPVGCGENGGSANTTVIR